jgi:hypothetical protein
MPEAVGRGCAGRTRPCNRGAGGGGIRTGVSLVLAGSLRRASSAAGAKARRPGAPGARPWLRRSARLSRMVGSLSHVKISRKYPRSRGLGHHDRVPSGDWIGSS